MKYLSKLKSILMVENYYYLLYNVNNKQSFSIVHYKNIVIEERISNKKNQNIIIIYYRYVGINWL